MASASASATFDFLKLPAEIRNHIYELLLTRPDHQPGPFGMGLRSKEPLGLSPAITCLCRQVYSECSALLYSGWFSAHPRMLTAFPFKADSARPVTVLARTQLIKKYYIEVRLDIDQPWSEDDLSNAFSGVSELHVYAWQPSFGLCGPDVLERFSKVRRVGKARVEGCGMPEDFSNWLESLMESDDSAEKVQSVQPLLPDWNTWDHANR